MKTSEIKEILERGEDSRHQFKKNITNAESLAGEMVAFANTKGGKFQSSDLVHADEVPVNGTGVNDIDLEYFKAFYKKEYTPIRLFIFDDRVEIISPGALPNNLTINNVKSGISNIRNAIITSFATKELPYRGIGTGIRRAVKNYPNIDFINDIEGDQFTAKIHRPDNF